MPNHVTNILTVEGDQDRIDVMLATIYGGKDEQSRPIYIDFNNVIPMPESLNIEESSYSKKAYETYLEYHALGETFAKAVENPNMTIWPENSYLTAKIEEFRKINADDPQLLQLGKQCYDNIEQYGAPSWYDWSVKNWGTKWNAYDTDRIGDNQLSFTTAWDGAAPIIGKLSEMYSDLHFSYEHVDEFGQNPSEYEFEGGECLYENHPADESEEGQALTERIMGEGFFDREDDEEMEVD